MPERAATSTRSYAARRATRVLEGQQLEGAVLARPGRPSSAARRGRATTSRRSHRFLGSRMRRRVVGRLGRLGHANDDDAPAAAGASRAESVGRGHRGEQRLAPRPDRRQVGSRPGAVSSTSSTPGCGSSSHSSAGRSPCQRSQTRRPEAVGRPRAPQIWPSQASGSSEHERQTRRARSCDEQRPDERAERGAGGRIVAASCARPPPVRGWTTSGQVAIGDGDRAEPTSRSSVDGASLTGEPARGRVGWRADRRRSRRPRRFGLAACAAARRAMAARPRPAPRRRRAGVPSRTSERRRAAPTLVDPVGRLGDRTDQPLDQVVVAGQAPVAGHRHSAAPLAPAHRPAEMMRRRGAAVGDGGEHLLGLVAEAEQIEGVDDAAVTVHGTTWRGHTTTSPPWGTSSRWRRPASSAVGTGSGTSSRGPRHLHLPPLGRPPRPRAARRAGARVLGAGSSGQHDAQHGGVGQREDDRGRGLPVGARHDELGVGCLDLARRDHVETRRRQSPAARAGGLGSSTRRRAVDHQRRAVERDRADRPAPSGWYGTTARATANGTADWFSISTTTTVPDGALAAA